MAVGELAGPDAVALTGLHRFATLDAVLDLLVGDDDERDGFEAPPANVSEGTQGKKTSQQAGFHVTGAGTNQLIAHRRERA